MQFKRLSDKATKWLFEHSSVELVAVASAKEFMVHLELQIELQAFVFEALSQTVSIVLDQQG